MVDPVSFLILILMSVGLSHAGWAHDRRNRLFWGCTPGVLLLFVVHPAALLFALASFVVAASLYMAGRHVTSPRIKARLPYLILLLLFVPDIIGFATANPILWLGSAFFIIRQMMTVTAALKEGRGASDFVPGLLLATFFFAALPSGPVFNGLRIWEALKANRKPTYAEGLYRLFEGFVYLFAFAGIASVAIEYSGDIAGAWAEVEHSSVPWVLRILVDPLLGFGFLFATFYGYSRMAEGTALLFGCEVPQNFDKPHLARDLSDFWKRWHRSMADFVMQYIYLPLLVSTSRAKLALIAAFTFMGLWHQFTLGFLVWGIGHGFALGIVLPWARRHNVPAPALRVSSLIYVVVLSAIAHGVWQ